MSTHKNNTTPEDSSRSAISYSKPHHIPIPNGRTQPWHKTIGSQLADGTGRLFQELKKIIHDDIKYTQLNVKFAAWSELLGHPFYWLLWTHILEKGQDNAFLRFSSATLCRLALLLLPVPARLKPIFSYYWITVVTYSLPVIFTYGAFANQFSQIWTQCQ